MAPVAFRSFLEEGNKGNPVSGARSAKGPRSKHWNFIFSTKYVMPKSFKAEQGLVKKGYKTCYY